MKEEKPEQMPEIEDIFVYHEKGYTHFVVISQDGEIYASNDIFLSEQVSRDNAIAKFREVKPFTSDHFRIVKIGDLPLANRPEFAEFYSAMFDATWKIEPKQSNNALTLSSEFFFITLEKENNEYIVSVMDYVKGDTEEKRFQTLNELRQYLDKSLDLNDKSEIWGSVVNLFNAWEEKKPISTETKSLTQILVENKVKASGDDPILILEPISLSIQLNPFVITINEKIEDAGKLFEIAGEVHKLLEPIHSFIPQEAMIVVPSLHDDYGYWDLTNPPSLEQIGIEEPKEEKPIEEPIEEKEIEEVINEVNTDPLSQLKNSTKAEIIVYMNEVLKMNVKPLAKNKDPKEKLLAQIESFMKSQEKKEEKPIEEKEVEKEVEKTLTQKLEKTIGNIIEQELKEEKTEEKPSEEEKTKEPKSKTEKKTKESKPKTEKKTKESKPKVIEEKTKSRSSEKPASLVDFKIETNKHIFYISVESAIGIFMVVKEFKISKSIKSFNFGSYQEMELWLENNGVTKDQITY